MKGKIFTVEEANHVLPLLSRIVDDIVITYPMVNALLEQFEQARRGLEKLKDVDAIKQQKELVDRLNKQVSEKLDRFQEVIEEAESLGAAVKDYERGYVDLCGEVDGQIVYYCWKRGEQAIGWFHEIDEGFGKRKSIPVSVPR